jgi:hypothetical protein
MTMNELDRRELLALRDRFLESMRRDTEVPLFDEEARRCIGEMISRSARQGRSEYACSSPPD